MSADLPDPERWCDLPARGANAEHLVGGAFRRVREATEPSDAALARVRRGVNAPARAMGVRLVWRLVVIAVLLAVTGSAVGAALYRWRRATAAPGAVPAAPAAATPPQRPQGRSKARAQVPVADVTPPDLPQPPPPAEAPVAS